MPANARVDFHAAFWEVYLAATLRGARKQLVPRAKRGFRSRGPDVLQKDPDIFYEAIAVKPGTAADAVVEAPANGVHQVPDAKICLRLASGLSEKVAAYLRYQADGTVPPGVPFIIAINAGAVPNARTERELPRIVRTVFPIGWQVVHLDTTTGRSVGSSYEYRPAVSKESGAEVSMRFFDDPDTAGISAVLYSGVDPFNWPEQPGGDFVLVHNPQGTSPIPRGLLPGAIEFWAEADRLRGERIPSAG